jgi:hypothetical protein
MSHRNLCVAALVILAGVGAAGCQSQADPAFATTDATALRAALRAYLDAANAGDAARWAAVYAEDAVMMPPNSPAVEGRAAVESWLAKLPVIAGGRDRARGGRCGQRRLRPRHVLYESKDSRRARTNSTAG